MKRENVSLTRRKTVNWTKNERKKKSGGLTKENKLSQLPDEIVIKILSTLIVFNKVTRGDMTCHIVTK